MKKYLLILSVLFALNATAGDTIRLHVNSNPSQGGIVQRNLTTGIAGRTLAATLGDVFKILSSDPYTMNIIFDSLPAGASAWGNVDITWSQSVYFTFAVEGSYVYHVDYFGTTLDSGLTINVGCLNIPSTITANNIKCNGAYKTSATVIPTGGATYTYLWSSNTGDQTDSTATGLSGGTYFVTLTDNNSCTKVDSIVIKEPSALSFSDTSTLATLGNCDGTATITVSGGTPPYSYLWNDNNKQTTPTATALCANNYNVMVKDSNNCGKFIIVTVNEAATSGLSSLEKHHLPIQLYPNPTTGEFTLSMHDNLNIPNAEVIVYNLLGEVVYQSNIHNLQSTIINLQSKGIYTLQLISDEGVMNRKIMVQ